MTDGLQLAPDNCLGEPRLETICRDKIPHHFRLANRAGCLRTGMCRNDSFLHQDLEDFFDYIKVA